MRLEFKLDSDLRVESDVLFVTMFEPEAYSLSDVDVRVGDRRLT